MADNNSALVSIVLLIAMATFVASTDTSTASSASTTVSTTPMSTSTSSSTSTMVSSSTSTMASSSASTTQAAETTFVNYNCSVWYYRQGLAYGPDYWPLSCPVSCNGSSQSPINILLSNLQSPTASMNTNVPLTVNVTQSSSTSTAPFILKNDGHKLLLQINTLITFAGAGLPNTFIADHVHWHWGIDSLQGSEHLVNGVAYPMEGHIVTYNSKYSSLSNALGTSDGVAVFGILYQESEVEDPIFSTFLEHVHALEEPLVNVNIQSLNFTNLLPISYYPFYRYSGSLTTPPCTQGLTWTVFAKTKSISSHQMQVLRSSMYFELAGTASDQLITNNYRITQPLNNRVVYLVNVASFLESSHYFSILALCLCAYLKSYYIDFLLR